jgi:hypothetical protein
MLRTTLGLAVWAVLLGACAQPASNARVEDDRPPPPRCRVGVHVTDQGNVVVDHEPVHTRGCDDGTAVVWQLRTAGYGFDRAKGVAFDKGSRPSGTCQMGANDRQYVCRFGGSSRGPFPYSIHVVGPSGPKTVDPTVIID